MTELRKHTVYFILLFCSRFATMMVVATYTIYLLDHAGLTQAQANMINAFFGVCMFLMEIPTGWIADNHGRKASYLASRFLCGAGFLLYGLSSSIPTILVAELIIAIGYTCSSGAFRAWAIDEHEYKFGKPMRGDALNQFTTVEGQVTCIAFIFAAPIGAYMADAYLPLPWLTGGSLFLIIGIIAALVMKENREVKPKSLTKGRSLGIEAIRGAMELQKNSSLRYVLAFKVTLAFGFASVNMLWQPIFKKAFDSVSLVGWVGTGISIALIIGAQLAKSNKLSGVPPKEEEDTKDETLKDMSQVRPRVAWAGIIVGIGIIWFGAASTVTMLVIAFLFHEVFRGFINPLVVTMTHNSIGKAYRATIDSVASMAHQGGYAIGLILFGLMSDAFGRSITLIAGGGSLVCSGLVLLAVMYTYKTKE